MPKNNAEFRIIEDAIIGEETSIWNFTHIRTGAIIGKKCNIGNNVYIDSKVIIGDNVKIQNGVNIYKGVHIGNDVFVGPSVTFTNDLNPRAFIWSDNKITETFIEDGVSIGANSTIRCGITLGEYSMVGAGSVVTKNISPYTIVVGNPARLHGLITKNGDIIKDFKKYIIKEDNISFNIEFEGKIIEVKK